MQGLIQAVNEYVRRDVKVSEEEWVENEEEMDENMDNLLEVVHRYMDVPKLTPTIVNEYIKKIIVYAPDKSCGHRQQKIKIYWNFLEEIELPEMGGTVVYQRSLKTQKTA